jgi:hypothetical protein
MNTFSLNYNLYREILSPLDQFEIRDLISLDGPAFGNLHISITNIGLYLTIAGLFIFVVNLLSTNYNKLVSNNWSISQESLYATIYSIVTNQINGKSGQLYFPFIYTLFIVILVNNLVGMVKRSLLYIFNLFILYNDTRNFNQYQHSRLCREYSCGCTKNSNSRQYSTSSKSPIYNLRGNNSYYLNPHYITGFVDAEGCFTTSIYKEARMLLKWQVKPIFKITVHNRDLKILEVLQRTWGVGKIYKHSDNASVYRVSSLKNLRIIIDHFDKYPLLTKKYADYLLFKQSVHLIENKAHLTMEGLLKLVSIKASLNWGLSDKFKESFPSIVPIARPEVKLTEIQDINWLVGFVEGEGCFMVNILQDINKTKYYISLNFTISQHDRDLNLLNSLIKYLNCGRCTSSRNEVNFIISKFADLNNKIIPMFTQYPMLGTKQADFLDFCMIAKLMENKEHLTKEGVERIKVIKSNMNSKRIDS